MGGAALPIIGGALGLYSAGSANRNQKRAVRAQEGIARNQTQLLKQASPYYNAVLQLLSQQAGLQVPGAGGTATPVTSAPGNPSVGRSPLPAGSGALPDSALGVFGQSDQDRIAYGQAEDQIGQMRDRRNEQLRFMLGRRGAGEATISSALAQNEGDYQSQLAAFRRNLALAARSEQERRLMTLLSALNPGLGAGAAAAGIYGGQANLAGNQALAAGSGAGSFLSNWMLAEAMRRGQGGVPALGNGGIAGYQDPAGLMALLQSQNPYSGGY